MRVYQVFRRGLIHTWRAYTAALYSVLLRMPLFVGEVFRGVPVPWDQSLDMYPMGLLMPEMGHGPSATADNNGRQSKDRDGL